MKYHKYHSIDALIQIALAHQQAGASRRWAVHRAAHQAADEVVASLGYQQIELRIEAALVEIEQRARAINEGAFAALYRIA
jgi:hypothetical protein